MRKDIIRELEEILGEMHNLVDEALKMTQMENLTKEEYIRLITSLYSDITLFEGKVRNELLNSKLLDDEEMRSKLSDSLDDLAIKRIYTK